MSAFTESVVEQAALAWLESVGWQVPAAQTQADRDHLRLVCDTQIRD